MDSVKIRFCDSNGYLIQNARSKSDIIQTLIYKYSLDIFNMFEKSYSDRLIDVIKSKPFYSCLITKGKPYILYLTKIKVSKASKAVEQMKTSAVVSQNKAVLKSSDDSDGIRIKSPIIGTAYLAPEPGAKKFVEVGDKIKKGQTVMIVEAMKTMNHVPSTANGEVKKILIEDSQPVEFGQTLVILK